MTAGATVPFAGDGVSAKRQAAVALRISENMAISIGAHHAGSKHQPYHTSWHLASAWYSGISININNQQ